MYTHQKKAVATVKLDADAHRIAKIAAASVGLGLAEWIERAIEQQAEREQQPAKANGKR